MTILMLLVAYGSIQAAEVPVHLIGSQEHLTDFQLGLIEDPERRFKLEEVAARAVEPQITASRIYLHEGQGDYWLILRLRNETRQPMDRVLRFDESFLDQVVLYQKVEGRWLIERNGIQVPVPERKIKNRLPTFLVSFAPEETRTFYLRLHPRWELLTIGLEVSSLERALLNEQWQTAGYFLYFGVSGAILLYNLFLLLTLRDRLYLFYVLYVANFMVFVLAYSGFDHYFIHDPDLHYSLSSNISLSMCFLVLFIGQLLHSSKRLPRGDKLLKALALLFLVVAVLTWIDLSAYKLVVISGMPVMLALFALAGVAVVKKLPLARFLLMAMGWYIAGLFMLAGINLGAVPFNLFTRFSYLFGSAAELLVFSLALAYRVRLLQQEKEAYQSRLISKEKEDKEELERQVSKRTVELAQANETKDKFFSIISHDLRGPVGSIAVVFNEVAHKGADIDDELFASIRTTARNTHQLLENLLTWARGQRGEIEYRPENQPVSVLVDSNLELFEATALKKGISLTADLEPDLWLFADPEMVSAVLRNLVNNALKFTDSGGRVTVGAQVRGNWVLMEVADTGVGITPEVKRKLFKLDQKVHSSLGTQSETGSGLGLILCAEFVRRHGGEIGVESVPGQGSRFWFSLPLGRAEEMLPPRDEKAPLNTQRVLLVEDNDLHRKTSSKILTDLDLDFVVAENGRTACEEFVARPFDLVLMDIDLPEMNGIEATAEIRRNAQNPVRILALSSYSKAELVELAGNVKFDGYLNKPLSKERLALLLGSLSE